MRTSARNKKFLPGSKSTKDYAPIQAYGETNLGLVRENNEDAYIVMEQSLVYAVADGLGGLPEGDIASSLAVAEVQKCALALKPKEKIDFEVLFSCINQSVYNKGMSIDAKVGIGTTLTVSQILGGTLHIGHVGDTGVYLLRDDKLQKLTVDHTLAQSILDTVKPNDPIPKIPDYFHHTLTRCMGHPSAVQVDCISIALAPKDKILMYSDGITKVISQAQLVPILNTSQSPKIAIKTIIALANESGGPDNITGIALFVK